MLKFLAGLLSVAAFLFSVGCAPAYTGGLIRNAADAAVLAKHKCGGGNELFGSWTAKLDGSTWTVSVVSQTGHSFIVAIDARTGNVGLCKTLAT